MYASRIRLLLSFLLLLPLGTALAATQITSVTPNRGIPTGGGLVVIRGTELIPASMTCDTACSPSAGCAWPRVWFGGGTAQVRRATPSEVTVFVPGGNPLATEPLTVDVRVEVDNVSTATLANAYTYDPRAQSFTEYVQYLVPTVLTELRGANGSLWNSELTVFTGDPMRAVAPVCNHMQPVPCDDMATIAADKSVRLQLKPSLTSRGDGAFIWVPKPFAYQWAATLRVRDVSREQHNWGTAVPIVEVERSYRPTQTLLDVPTDPRYRTALRIYGRDNRPWGVEVMVYPASGGEALAHLSLTLADASPATDQNALPLHPGYAILDPITDAVRASGHERVRIEVAAAIEWDPPPPTQIWAMVSLTNNETQQVTIITPRE